MIVDEIEKPVSSEPSATANVKPAARTVYFTEGEMLPWKGKWFKVRLMEIDGEKVIGLVLLKDTAKATKLAKRSERWRKQHPKALIASPVSSV